MGGTLLSETTPAIDGKSAWDWLAATLAELGAMPNVRLMHRTTAIGYYHQMRAFFTKRADSPSAAKATTATA